MKKRIFIIGILVLFNEITIAQGSYWNRALQQIGYGDRPDRDYSKIDKYTNKYRNELGGMFGDTPSETKKKDKKAHNLATGREEGKRKGRHLGRYEGARNTALGAAVVYGTYLGGKALYNWYRGPLHHINSELQALIDKTEKLKIYIQKYNKTAPKNSTMKNILASAVGTDGYLLKSLANVNDLKKAMNELKNND